MRWIEKPGRKRGEADDPQRYPQAADPQGNGGASVWTLKWYDGYHYFLCRGKEKVAAETALSFMSYDIRRAITLTTDEHSPVPGILMYLRARNEAKRAG